jgi:hypothetical protein
MKDMLLFLAVVAVAGVVFIPLHVVAIRLMRGHFLISTINASIGVAMIAGAAAGWFMLGGEFSSEGTRLMGSLGGAVAFSGFATTYALIVPISVDRSVSSHIVGLLFLMPGHRMTEEKLFGLYTHADMLEKRFDDCIGTGIVVRQGKELVLTPFGRRIARIYLSMGTMLGMRMWHLERFRNTAGTLSNGRA